MSEYKRRVPPKTPQPVLVPIAICIGWMRCDGIVPDFPMFNLLNMVSNPIRGYNHRQHSTVTVDTIKECIEEKNIVFPKVIKKNTYVYKKAFGFAQKAI